MRGDLCRVRSGPEVLRGEVGKTPVASGTGHGTVDRGTSHIHGSFTSDLTESTDGGFWSSRGTGTVGVV